MLAGDLRFIECVSALRFQAPSAKTRLTEPWHQVEMMMTPTSTTAGYELADFNSIPGVPCPCGMARRAFEDVADFPGTIHQTSISSDAQTHYHKRLTETYVFLECGPDAAMELDGERIAVRPGMSIMIRPGTRHRAVGEMQVLIVCLPKFDPADEWFD